MRIKISIANSKLYNNINIQNIVFKYKEKESSSMFYFKCNKKFENLFSKETIIFHNSRGKEIFRSSNVRLDYKYYEDDTKEKKVRFLVADIEFENYGQVSNYYMLKVLKTACNAQTILIQKHVNHRAPKYGTGVMRYVEQIKNMKYKSIMYKKFIKKMRYIFIKIVEQIYKTVLQSTAPT